MKKWLMVIFFTSILSSIAGNTNDLFIGNDARDASVEIDLEADKSSVSQVGEIITYTYTVTNNGDETLTNVSVTDDKLGEISLKKRIEPYDIATGSAEYSVTRNDLDAGDDIENEATVTTDQGVSETDDESVSIIRQPGLTVTKSASPTTYSSVGEDISYTIKVENSGNVTIMDITVTDPLTGMTENISNLASGDSETYTETYTITQSDLNSGTVENTATATDEPPDDDDDNVNASATETITGNQQPALSITKTASPSTFNSVGEEITYTIDVENTGNVELTNVSVTDPLTGLDDNISNMLPGATEIYTSTYIITQADLNAGSVENTATASGTAPNNSTVTASDTETVQADQNPELVVTKSALPENFANVGSEITYTILVENTGNVTVSEIEVIDLLINLNAVIPSLAPGNTINYVETYEVTQSNYNNGSVTNTVSVSGRGPGNSLVNAESSLIVNALGPPVASNDINSDNIIGNSVAIDILANDKLQNGDNATPDLVTIDLNPEQSGVQNEFTVNGEGAWSYNATTGQVSFNPVAGFTTDPSPITYQLTENLTGRNDNANITVEYNEGEPFAINDTSEGNKPGNTVTLNILANDMLSDGTPVSSDMVNIDLQPQTAGLQIELIVEGEGSWIYSPQTGVVTFTPVAGFTTDPEPVIYLLTEILTGLSDEGTISILFDEEPPVANDDNNSGNTPGESVNINILENDRLSDGTAALPGIVTVDLNSDTEGIQTELIVQGQGTWSFNPLTGVVTFNPEEGFTASPSPVTYILIENLNGLSHQADITVSYEEAPPVAVNDSSLDNPPGSSVSVNILENDKLSNGSPALPEQVIVDIDLITDGIQTELMVEGEGNWIFDDETGIITFTPLPFFFSNPTPLVYRLSTKENPGLYAEATVFIYIDKEMLTSSISLVKMGEYNPLNGTIRYTFEVTNTGEITLWGIEIDDERIGITDLEIVPDTLAPGSTGTASATYELTQADIDAGGVTNSAKVSSFNLRGDPVEDDSGSEPDNDEPTVTIFEQNPSVYIEKEAVISVDEVALGDVVNFNISVGNTGNVTLFNVFVEDPLTGFEQESEQLLPGESLNFTTEYTVQIVDITEGQFDNVAIVSASTQDGSLIEASSTVTVQVERCELVIPTGFSPNDDGIQDTWRIKCLENYPDARVEIFNRWGNLVFEKNNFGNSDVHGADAWWDGYSSKMRTFGDNILPAGTYFFVLNLNDGNEPITGHLFLKR